MKKILTFILAGLIAASLVSCGSSRRGGESVSDSTTAAEETTVAAEKKEDELFKVGMWKLTTPGCYYVFRTGKGTTHYTTPGGVTTDSFTYETKDGKTTFTFSDKSEPSPCTVEFTDDSHATIKWDDGKSDILEFVGPDTTYITYGKPFLTGTWKVNNAENYYYFNELSGKTKNSASGAAGSIAFTYTVDGEKYSFSGLQNNASCYVSFASKTEATLVWETGLIEELTYVSSGTLEENVK